MRFMIHSVEGASTMPVATGVANVALGDGTVVTAFVVCGRDFASDQEFAGALKSCNCFSRDEGWRDFNDGP